MTEFKGHGLLAHIAFVYILEGTTWLRVNQQPSFQVEVMSQTRPHVSQPMSSLYFCALFECKQSDLRKKAAMEV